MAKGTTYRFGKGDIRYWREALFKPKYYEAGRKVEAKNWAIRIQYLGRRRAFGLGTQNQEAAAARAKDLYFSLQANGWEQTLAKYRPDESPSKANDPTVGEFLDAVRATADIKPFTMEGYFRCFRRIVADVAGIEAGKKKFDYRKGGQAEWLAKVQGVKLSKITPSAIQAWKKSFLAKARPDPISQRRAKVSVNSFLRQARSLFSARNVLPHLKETIDLPVPLPFSQINFEEEPSLKYKSNFDVRDLIKKAKEELSKHEPEVFKSFLLAVMAGLRRKEIDLLEWSSFRWPENVIRIETTEFFEAKTEDSVADIQIDKEIVELFRGYRARAKSEFVIEAQGKAKIGLSYQHYRCQKVLDRLIEWLRAQGVSGNKPIHTLRKEFGSEICAAHGIHAASRALRHADIGVTNEYYTDSRARITAGLGHLLTDEEDGGEEEEKIIPVNGKQARRKAKV